MLVYDDQLEIGAENVEAQAAVLLLQPARVDLLAPANELVAVTKIPQDQLFLQI